MKKNHKSTVFLMLLFAAGILSVIVRLYHLNAPVADWHSWRQADTAAVARNFRKFSFDLTRPRYDDLSNIQSGKDNPEGWRMVEFPLFQAAGYGLNRLIPQHSIETSLRLVSIFATAGSVVLLGILLFEMNGLLASGIGMFLYAVLPFSIYYGRSILPDPFSTFWALLSLVILAKSGPKYRLLWGVIAAGSAAISLLVRPMSVFLLLPALTLLMRNFSLVSTSVTMVLYGVISVVPLLVWRNWILNFPEGIAASDWLFNKGNIRFKGAWFYWIFARRIAELILGYWGVIPFGLGLAATGDRKERIFSFLWFSGAVLYVVIFAGGNVQHDYYQALIIPVIIWFTAKGLAWLLRPNPGMSRSVTALLALVTVIYLWMFSWYTVRTYFWINHPEIIEAGSAVDSLVPKDAKVIAPYSGDTTFLYQTDRQGWPIGFEIDKKISMGARYYVTVASLETDYEARDLARKYTVISGNARFTLIDLTRLSSGKQ